MQPLGVCLCCIPIVNRALEIKVLNTKNKKLLRFESDTEIKNMRYAPHLLKSW